MSAIGIYRQPGFSHSGVLRHERACTLVIFVYPRNAANVGSSEELQLFVTLEQSKP